MKNFKPLIVVGLLLGLSRFAGATCTGGGDPCNVPRNGSVTAHSATTISLQVQNSATPNVTGSIYFFQETTAGSAQNATTPDSNTEVIFTNDPNNPATASDLIGLRVGSLLAGTSYQGYSKVCPPGSSLPTAAGCSAWVVAGSAQITDALTNVGFRDIAGADTQPQQFIARTNAAAIVDQQDVNAWLITLVHSTEVGDCSISKTLSSFPPSGDQQLTVTSTDCNTLVPNRPYTVTEHLQYTPTQAAPDYVTSTFYTQAANPLPINSGSVGATSITHCSAVLTFQNAASAPANPADTNYIVNVGGAVSSGSAGSTAAIGGTGVFTDQNSVTFTNLQAGVTYSPSVTALNRGGNPPWLNSTSEGYDNFQTISWGGVFSVNGITTTDASFNIISLNTTGVSSWQLVLNGNLVGSSNTGTPPAAPSSITYSSQGITLTPNTAYQAQIQLVEASGCSSRLPVTPVSFTTNADVPTGFGLSIVSPTQLNATWSKAGNPAPNSVTYTVQYCTDSGFTQNCQTPTTTATSLSLTGLTPETTYYGHVLAQTVGGGANSAYSNSDFKLTPNAAPVLAVPTYQLWSTSATMTTSATDNGGPSHLVFVWSISAGGSLTSTSGTTSIGGGTATNVTQVVFSGGTTANGTVVVYDHDHDNSSAMLSASRPWNTAVGQTPTTLSISPGTQSVGRGQTSPTFTVTVKDQFGVTIAGSTATWAISAAAGTLSPNNSVTTVLTAGNNLGTFSMSATNGAATGTASVTIAANVVTLSPANPTVGVGSTQQFTATEKDPNNVTITPPLTWTITPPANGNVISSTGLFTANGLGTFVVNAFDAFGDTGTATIIVNATTPHFTVSPSATVFLTSATFHAVAAGFNSPSALTYTWSLLTPVGVPVGIASNGDNAATISTATFHQAGLYTFRCTVTDTTPGFGGSTSADFPVTVTAVLESITVSPNPVTIQTSQLKTFSAAGTDQFSLPLSPLTVTWSASAGTIGVNTGVFNSPTLLTGATVRAQSGLIVGTATVNVLSYDLGGAYAYPVPYKASAPAPQGNGVMFTGLGSDAHIRIYTPSGRKVFETETTDGKFLWPVKNSSGENVASGVYFYVIESPDGKKDGKLIIIK